jgi:lipoprotein-releasing system permease protein
MGATRWQVTRIFLRQGMTIAITGTVLGNVFAFGLCWAQLKFRFFSLPSDIYFMSSVPILLKWQNFALVSSVVFILCVLSSFLPSKAAAKLDVITSLRFG